MKENFKILIWIEATIFFSWGITLLMIFIGMVGDVAIRHAFIALPIVLGGGFLIWMGICLFQYAENKWSKP